MIKNIETMTAQEFLKIQIEKGLVPDNYPIFVGDKINFSPNSIELKKSIEWQKNRKGIFGKKSFL